jgi:hypothetical protein
MVASYARAGAPRRQESFTRADFLRRLALASLSVGVTADVLNACSGAALKPSGSTTPSMAASPNGAVQLPASTQATPATGAVRLLMPGGGIDRAVLKAWKPFSEN